MRFLTILLIAGRCLAVTASAGNFSALNNLIEGERAKVKIPGQAAAVYYHGEVVWVHHSGMADVRGARAVRRDTPFRLASISKSISAVGLLQLLENRKLALSDDVRKYCPAFPPKPFPISLGQLLGHTAGIRHYNVNDPADMNNAIVFPSLVDSLRKFGADPLMYEPGSKYLYTTYGYSLVGCAIEGASGMPYEKFIADKVLATVGMCNTASDNGRGVSARRCQGYRKTAAGAIESCAVSDNSAKTAGGGLVSTVDDLLRFADGIFKGTLLKKETVDLMWTSGKLNNGKLTGYGLGWSLSRSPDGDREIFHTGGQQGASTILYLRPEQKFAFVWLTNLEGLENRLPVSRQAFKIVTGK